MKNIQFVAVLGLALLGAALSPQAADQPALDENLKPLAKGLGQWSYVYKDEKGRELPSTFTCNVAAGGKVVVVRDQSVKDGKLLWASLNISYWQPETKSIAGFYVDSTGMHANTVLTKSGDTQVWQGYGYDAKGKFGTAVSTVEYQGDDTFVSQMTHIVLQGQVLPDSPKLTLKRSKDVPFQLVKQPTLNRKIKPLAKVIGKWSYRWPSDKGEFSNAKEIRSIDAGGAIITCEGEEIDKNGKVYSYLSVNYWQAEAKSIGAVSFDSEGRHSFSIVNTKQDKIIRQNYGYNGKGMFETSIETDEFQGVDTVLYQMTHHISGGEMKPDEPTTKLTIKRIKE
jgi:hypothetical protein